MCFINSECQHEETERDGRFIDEAEKQGERVQRLHPTAWKDLKTCRELRQTTTHACKTQGLGFLL